MSQEHEDFDHQQRVEQLATDFGQAQQAVLRRLAALTDEQAAVTPPDGGWNAAQIGWHVATVNQSLRGILCGERGTLAEPPMDFIETWEDKERPAKLQAPAPFLPPSNVSRDEAIKLVAEASEAMTEAILALTPEDARKVTHLRFGLLSLYQVAEFARMHTQRHLGQLDRVLSAI